MDADEKTRHEEDKAKTVQEREAARRKEALNKLRAMKRRQLDKKRTLEAAQKKERMALKRQHLEKAKRIRELRAKAKTSGLAAFLGRVTGMDKLIHQVRRMNDRRRLNKYKASRDQLSARQDRAMAMLRERHRMQLLDTKRQIRSVDKVEKREKKSRDVQRQKERRMLDRVRNGVEHMQAIDQGRYDVLRKPIAEKEQATSLDRQKGHGVSLDDWRGGRQRLGDVFDRAVSGEKREGRQDGRGAAGAPKHKTLDQQARQRRRRRDQDRER